MVRKATVYLCFLGFIGLLAFALVWIARVAFGMYPLLHGHRWSIAHLQGFVFDPQFMDALLLSVGTALASTLLSLALGFMLLASIAQSRLFQRLLHFLSPVMALPHALMAMGIIVLMAPTGWLVRWVWWLSAAPNTPPDYTFAPDSLGVGMVFALVIKETAFLVLMLIAHVENNVYARQLVVARSLGYGTIAAWCKILIPQLYAKIRLPVLAVLVFSAATVEVPLITNSFDAPTLSILIYRDFQDANLQRLFAAAAGSMVLLAVCLGLVLLWFAAERAVGWLARSWLSNGGRTFAERLCPATVALSFGVMIVVVVLAFFAMLLHGLSFRWAFPDILPESTIFSRPQLWHGVALLDGLTNSILLAVSSSLLAIALCTVALLSLPQSSFRLVSVAMYLPLLLPQVAVMMGIQFLLLSAGFIGNFAVVIMLHTLFVLPYVFIALAGALRLLDRRYIVLAQTFGLGWWRRLWRVILPLTLRPMLVAFALGFAVSQSQFLATQMASRGRTETVMTHFMLVASGGNMREIAQVGLVLVLLVAVPFSLSVWLPALLYRGRGGMRLQG